MCVALREREREEIGKRIFFFFFGQLTFDCVGQINGKGKLLKVINTLNVLKLVYFEGYLTIKEKKRKFLMH